MRQHAGPESGMDTDAQLADEADAADRGSDIDACMEFLDDVFDRESIQCDDV